LIKVSRARKKQSETRLKAVAANVSQPTVFERAMDINAGLREAVGLEPLPYWKRRKSEPDWVRNINFRLRNTILKSVCKLRPKGVINWRNYGRCVGCIERYKAFQEHDVPRLLENLLEECTEERWNKIQAQLGEEQARQYYLKILGRPADDKATLDEVWELVHQREMAHLSKVRETAVYFVAQQTARDANLFWVGVGEGYSIFLNVEGEFSGDDRRADVYMELLSIQNEIEKMRRKLPAISRNDLRDELKKSPDFGDRGQKWFNDVCDEIELSMKGQGRAHDLNPR
jgi:hypothetical protein